MSEKKPRTRLAVAPAPGSATQQPRARPPTATSSSTPTAAGQSGSASSSSALRQQTTSTSLHKRTGSADKRATAAAATSDPVARRTAPSGTASLTRSAGKDLARQLAEARKQTPATTTDTAAQQQEMIHALESQNAELVSKYRLLISQVQDGLHKLKDALAAGDTDTASALCDTMLA